MSESRVSSKSVDRHRTAILRLVQMHGGSIEARGQGLGRGTEIEIVLPLKQEHSDVVASGAVRQSPCGYGPMLVLIVDDNEDIAETLALLLEPLGHRTRIANNGLTAFEVAAVFRPQAAFLDISLPGLSGYEVCSRLRVQPGARTR